MLTLKSIASAAFASRLWFHAQIHRASGKMLKNARIHEPQIMPIEQETLIGYQSLCAPKSRSRMRLEIGNRGHQPLPPVIAHGSCT
jgi:hypothetical protein